MHFLTPREKQKLQQILINNRLLQTSDSDFRSHLLINCGLGRYCSVISLDKPLDKFVISLCAKLSQVYIQIDNSERLGLIIFLEYISYVDTSLSIEDHNFIKYIITKCEEWQLIHQKNQPCEPLSSINELANIRTNLLKSQSLRELQSTLYEVDEFLSRYPNDVEGRLLKRDIVAAIKAEKIRNSTVLCDMELESAPSYYRLSRIIFVLIMLLLAVLLIFFLVQWIW